MVRQFVDPRNLTRMMVLSTGLAVMDIVYPRVSRLHYFVKGDSSLR